MIDVLDFLSRQLELFSNYIYQLSALSVILTVFFYAHVCRGNFKAFDTGELIGLALMGGGIPWGILFACVPFDAELVKKLPPILICALGAGYTAYAFLHIKDQLSKKKTAG